METCRESIQHDLAEPRKQTSQLCLNNIGLPQPGVTLECGSLLAPSKAAASSAPYTNFGIQTNPYQLVHIGVSAHPGGQFSNPGPKARSIPAWGNAPGFRRSDRNTRAVSPPNKRLWSGPTVLVYLIIASLGRCPRLVWNAPSALMIALRRNLYPSGIRAALSVMLCIGSRFV